MVRFKNRWVLFQVAEDPVIEDGHVVYKKSQFEINDYMISKVIFNAVELNYGAFGKGQGSVTVKWYNSTTRIGILRIPRDYTDLYLASMFYIKQIGTTPCSLHILHVSGTVIFIQQKAIEWDRKYYIKEQQDADIRGQTYSSTENIEASKRALAALS